MSASSSSAGKHVSLFNKDIHIGRKHRNNQPNDDKGFHEMPPNKWWFDKSTDMFGPEHNKQLMGLLRPLKACEDQYHPS
jgi:hypothetical protein